MSKKRKLICFLTGLSLSLASASLAGCSFGLPNPFNSGSSASESVSESSNVESSSSSVVDEESSSNGGGSSSVEEASLTISGSGSMTEFETMKLTAKLTGSTATIAWSSSDKTIATVEQDGTVTALKSGNVTVTARAGDLTATHSIAIAKTNIAHRLAFSVGTATLFEGETDDTVSVSVLYGEETLDDEKYGIRYTWSYKEGDEAAVELTPSADGSSVTLTGKKAGSVTYTVATTARGYDVHEDFTIVVKEEVASLTFANTAMQAGEGEYLANLTFGSTETENLTIGDVLLAKNGVPTETKVDVAWTKDSEEILSLSDGKLSALKAGTVLLTGTATYEEETLEIKLRVTVSRAQIALENTLQLETENAQITLPEAIEGVVEKVTVNADNVIFDAAEELGSLDGKTLTANAAGLPAKMSDLGKGQTLTVQTEKTVYTLSVDVYTMIIDNKEELDKWQEIAAENAVRAGICIEQQKGFAYSGYFLLNADIDYNGVWRPYKTYNEISKLSTVDNKQLNLEGVQGAINESWTYGINGGFQGIFDGCGHNIDGLQTTGPYGGFIVVNGKDGVVQNLSFTNAEIGIASSLVVERGQGTVRDVYMQIKKFSSEVYVTKIGEEEKREGAVTFYKSGNGPERTVERVLIDVTDCGLTDLEEGYLGSRCDQNAYQGVYVIGAAETLSEHIFYSHDKATVGDFATLADLLADGTHGTLVKTWNTEFWEIGEKYVLPKSIVNNYKGGDIVFEEAEEEVNCGAVVSLRTNRDSKYIVYSLSEEVEGVTLVGNKLTIADTATVGSSVTIVATSVIDGKTAEYTFTIAAFAQTYAVNAPAENDYYTFVGKERATEGKAYTFALTATYANCKDFVVFVNDEKIAAVDGAYTVPNVTGDLTIKVLHGYLEHGANVTVTYNDDGSIKLENAVQNWNFNDGEDAEKANTQNAPYFAWISAEYIQYKIDQGYKTVNFTAQSDNTIAKRVVVTYNGGGCVWEIQGNKIPKEQALGSSCEKHMYFCVQDGIGSGNAIKDQGGYMTIWGLQFLKEAIAVNTPEDSLYYTFTGTNSVEKGGDYTFEFAFTEHVINYTVFVNGTEVTLAEDGSYTVTNVTEIVTITVEMETDACTVITPAESCYYIFNGESAVAKGENYTFTVTAKDEKHNEFIVLANGNEITANEDGVYTVENIQDTLTIKVIHGYIEHESNITITYNEDGSIKFEKIVAGSSENNNGWISKDYINYMISKGYTKLKFTVQLSDTEKVNQGCIQFNGSFVVEPKAAANATIAKELTEATTDLKFWLQKDGSGWKVQDGGYMTITGLQFMEADIVVNTPEESIYYTFTGENAVEKGGNYTFKLAFTDDVESYTVSVNGAEVTLAEDGSYTVTNVTEAVTVKVMIKATAACEVVAPATSSYYTFNGAETVQKGENYTFTLTATVENCNEFIVFANDEEITAVDGTYTVANVQDTLTIKVIHGYIEHGANVTVTYNDDGSIKLENAVFGIIDADWKKPYEAFISADYINYMIGKGYATFSATVVPDGTIAAQAFIRYNGSNIIGYQKETDANSCIKELGTSATDNMYIWVQNSGGSGNSMKDQGGYMTITGLAFSKGEISVTAPAASSYYTFNGAETVKNGENYTFTLTATVENCNKFIVFANGNEITANEDGVYTVANVQDTLTIKVLHGYIEHGSNISITYNEDGSIKFEKKEAALNVDGTNNFGWISKDYINYMISQGYKTISLTITLSDATKANCGMVKDKTAGTATIDLSLWQADNTYEKTQNTKTVSLTAELTEDLKFWLQHNGSHWKVQDGGYMTITGLTFSK